MADPRREDGTPPGGGDAPLFPRSTVDGDRPLFPPSAVPRRQPVAPSPGHPGGDPPDPRALPRGPAAAGPTAGPAAGPAAVASGDVVGIVNGAVSVDRVRPRHPGFAVLAGAGILAIGVLVTGAVVGWLPVRAFLSGLVAPALALLALAGAGRLTRRGDRSTAGSLTADGVPVRRFRVRALTGGTVPCVFEGEPTGVELRTGDLVRVVGRRTRQGHLAVRRVLLLAAPGGPSVGTVTARLPWPARAERWVGRLCVALAVLQLGWIGYAVVAWT